MKRSRIRSRSKKTEALYRERREMVSRLLRNAVCAVRWDDGCSGTATVVHEPLTRARGGSIVDPENAVVSCWNCHRQIHDNPARAIELGWLIPSR